MERRFALQAPIDEVFTYFSDFTRTEAWDPGTVVTERISGAGPGLGTEYRNVSEFAGREVSLTYETVVFDPPNELRFRGYNEKSVAQDWFRFSAGPTSDFTLMHYRADFWFHGWLKVAAPLAVLTGEVGYLGDGRFAS